LSKALAWSQPCHQRRYQGERASRERFLGEQRFALREANHVRKGLWWAFVWGRHGPQEHPGEDAAVPCLREQLRVAVGDGDGSFASH